MLRFRHVWPVCSWQEGLWQLRVAADCNGKFDRRDHSRRDAVPQHNSPGIFFVHFVYLCDINNKYRFGHCINIKIQLLPCGPIGNSSWNLLNRQQIVYPQQMIYLIFKHLPLVIYIFIITKKSIAWYCIFWSLPRCESLLRSRFNHVHNYWESLSKKRTASKILWSIWSVARASFMAGRCNLQWFAKTGIIITIAHTLG